MAAARSRSGLDRRQVLTAAGLGAGASATSAQAATPQVRVAAPRVDYLENPLGLDNRRPRFSWALEAGAARDVKQTVYRVTVASNPEALRAGGSLLWDSGKIASDRSLDVAYEGPPLASGQRCW